MPADNILVLAIDGLRASALGAYGNTTFPTPALDELAGQSFLFDECFANAVALPLIYQALWNGLSSMRGKTTATEQATLPRWFSDHSYATTLVTDEPAVASLIAADAFDDCMRLSPETVERGTDVSQTTMAELFSAVCELIEDQTTSPSQPRLLWVHSRAMYGPWDAPLELQDPLLAREEGDPEPNDAIAPPDFAIAPQSDPDAAFRSQCAYGAQVIALDECLAGLLQVLRHGSADARWLIVLCGVRGFPLGEHERVGGVDERLFAEQLHVPMLWRFPDGLGLLARDGQLASQLDMLPTLVDHVGPREGAPEMAACDGISLLPRIAQFAVPTPKVVVSASMIGTRSIRTAEWSLRCEPPSDIDRDTAKHELFVRPDDRWEANDIAGLCPEIVDDLVSELRKYEESLTAGQSK